jgi:hypothetical protein
MVRLSVAVRRTRKTLLRLFPTAGQLKRRSETSEKISLGGLAIVAGLHVVDIVRFAEIGSEVAGLVRSADFRTLRSHWLSLGDAKFQEYEMRGRWEAKTHTRHKIIMGGILRAARLDRLPSVTLLGALVDAASREFSRKTSS